MKASQIYELNQNTGFYKIINAISDTVQSFNILIISIGGMLHVAKLLGAFSSINYIPEFISDYDCGIIVALNAILLLVLNNAHNRYYSIYIRYTRATSLGFTIDLFIRSVLLATTFLQIFIPEAFIFMCCLLYILTFLRNVELKRSMNKKNPLYHDLSGSWLPNNIRHNIVMLLFSLIYYMGRSNLLYIAVNRFLMNQPLDIADNMYITMRQLNLNIYSVYFVFYWVYRVLNKVVVKKQRHLKAENLKKLDEEEELFYEKLV